MPLSRLGFVRATLLLLLAGALVLAAIIVTSLWLAGRTQSFSDAVMQAREVRSAAADLRSAVQDAETGQRGFLLTQNAAYLDPYTAGRTQVDAGLARLRTLLAADPSALGSIDGLQRLLHDKLAELARTIDLARSGQHEEALALVRTDAGKNLMDEARTIFSGLIAATDAKLDARSSEQQRSASALQWVTLVGAVLIALVVGGSAATVVRYPRDLVVAREEVRSLNVGLEERVVDRTRELTRANEEIQRFAYIVSHDLRAPLVNIMGFTSEIEEVLPTARAFLEREDLTAANADVEQVRLVVQQDLPEAIGFIRASTSKMDRLIGAILRLSREGRRTLAPEAIALRGLLETAAASVQHQVAETGGTIRIEEGAPRLVTDRVALEQIVGNLVDNAVKYRHPERPIAIALTCEASAKALALTVTDNGRGIATQDHERIFEIFRRAGVQDTQGEGIGLAYVRALARRLGGDVTVVSVLGQGSSFRVTLAKDLRALQRAA